MTIQEQLRVVNATFEKLHIDFSRIEAEKSALDRKFASISDSIHEKYAKQAEGLTAQKNDVLNCFFPFSAIKESAFVQNC